METNFYLSNILPNELNNKRLTSSFTMIHLIYNKFHSSTSGQNPGKNIGLFIDNKGNYLFGHALAYVYLNVNIWIPQQDFILGHLSIS